MRADKGQAAQELLVYDREVIGDAGLLAGVDEVGRGPLAGPVVGCAVVLPPDADLPGLDDSKKLSVQQREKLFDSIMSQALSVSLASVGERLIDSIDILRASILAMTWAVESLDLEPDMLLVDGPYRLPASCRQRALVGGDGISLSVAAASVIAKVTRDELMIRLDETYPHYRFQTNKGYGTQSHLEALSRHGPCPAHRYSFAPVKISAQRSLI
jgi:ribonuclease HII